MTAGSAALIDEAAIANWSSGDDHALLWYRPASAADRDAASRLLLRFKDRYADAITAITELTCSWVASHEHVLRARGVGYVLAAPRSSAGHPNVPCERVAAALAGEFGWLQHLPNAVTRTQSVEPAHRGGTRSISHHLETIAYTGPPLADSEPVVGLRCTACGAEFADVEWLSRHIASPRHRFAVTESPAPGVLVLDDVTTSGATFAALRHLIRRDAGADAVIALAAGRTTRDSLQPRRAENRDGWAVLFDLDGTLVDSLKLKRLRDARRWTEVHAAFHLSHVLPGTAAMLAEVESLGSTGVVTMAPRRYAQALLDHHNLDIPVLVGYEDVRRRKPHPDPILRAADALGVLPERTIYVGDEGRDMVAAHRAGAHAIAFGSGLLGHPDARTAAAHASNWTDVVHAVRRIVRG